MPDLVVDGHAACMRLLVTALTYGAAILLLGLGGATPNPAPWLVIPKATYFYWEAAFIPFVILLSTVLTGGLAQLASRMMGGTGTFEMTLAGIASATASATWASLVPDLGIGLALVTGWLSSETWMRVSTHWGAALALIWVYLLVYTGLFLVLYPRAIRAAHGLSRGRSILVGAAAFVVYQGVLFIFIR